MAILADLVKDLPLEFDFLFSQSQAEVISGKQEGTEPGRGRAGRGGAGRGQSGAGQSGVGRGGAGAPPKNSGVSFLSRCLGFLCASDFHFPVKDCFDSAVLLQILHV